MAIKVSEVHKFGRNASVATTFEPIVDENAQANAFPAAAATTTVVSTDTADDADVGGGTPGTGALTVTIFGVNDAGAYIQETVSMNGTSAVTCSTDFRIVLRAYVATAGTGKTNAGRIDIKHTSTIIASISIAEAQSEILAWYVAADAQGARVDGVDLGIEVISTKTIEVEGIVERNGVKRVVFHQILDTSTPAISVRFPVSMTFLPNDLIYVQALGSTGTTGVYGRLYIEQW